MKLRITGIILAAWLSLLFLSCENEESLEFKRYYSIGAEVYQTHCQNCHGAKGEGLSALIPPLNDSVYLKNNKTALACYLRFGMKGTITVNKRTFDDAMPAGHLSPMETAQVLTYISNSFGNKLGTINADQVTSDLTNCK